MGLFARIVLGIVGDNEVNMFSHSKRESDSITKLEYFKSLSKGPHEDLWAFKRVKDDITFDYSYQGDLHGRGNLS